MTLYRVERFGELRTFPRRKNFPQRRLDLTRESPRRTGATPLFETLVRVWGGVCFHNHRPALRGVAPVH